MPEPRIAETPSTVSSESFSSPVLCTARIVWIVLMTISGAAEPKAMKEAPAMSSRMFQRKHSVSSAGAR